MIRTIKVEGYSILEVVVSTIIILIAFLMFSSLVDQLLHSYNTALQIRALLNHEMATGYKGPGDTPYSTKHEQVILHGTNCVKVTFQNNQTRLQISHYRQNSVDIFL